MMKDSNKGSDWMLWFRGTSQSGLSKVSAFLNQVCDFCLMPRLLTDFTWYEQDVIRFSQIWKSRQDSLDFTESVCGLCRKIRLTDFVAERSESKFIRWIVCNKADFYLDETQASLCYSANGCSDSCTAPASPPLITQRASEYVLIMSEVGRCICWIHLKTSFKENAGIQSDQTHLLISRSPSHPVKCQWLANKTLVNVSFSISPCHAFSLLD